MTLRPISGARITATTLGRGNPAHLTEGRWYRWNGDPAKAIDRDAEGSPLEPRTRATQSAQARAERMAVFSAARTEGLPVREAGERAGVAIKTAREYERERRGLPRRESAP